ncbi:hypothetical protein [Marinovum sp.]|uniref:hypothetical protein n=1 Tax=Marinovum sp. TaxID=2024839 RepID=UPI002B279ED7|nr:hypothetical protein [Marinovum sp.]
MTHMPMFLDQTSYLTLNRFWGHRNGNKLAALNALYVDLDYFSCIGWQGKSPNVVQAAYTEKLSNSGMPDPTIYLHTGRGLAVIWLIEEIPVSVLPRWQGAMRALVEFSDPFGADKKCKDAVRIFRIPGSTNEKCGKTVRVSGGTGRRHNFDALADQIYIASGRPTRAELETKRKQRKRKRESGAPMPRGLPPAHRFKLILEDLEVFRGFHGGLIPTGMRNTWLHFVATCLTHIPDVADIAEEVRQIAEEATPGLPRSEVEAIAKQASSKSKLPYTSTFSSNGRYQYAGATIAENLGITPAVAREIGLKQIIPDQERKRRRADAERRRREEKGARTRAEYLQKNCAAREQPWKALNIGRTKYYELKREGKLPGAPTV